MRGGRGARVVYQLLLTLFELCAPPFYIATQIQGPHTNTIPPYFNKELQANK